MITRRGKRKTGSSELFSEFDEAKRDHDMGSIMFAVEKAKRQALGVLEGAVATATIWESDFPCEELKAIVTGRKRQLVELNGVFTAVTKGVTIGAELQKPNMSNTYIMGAWGF